MYYVKDGIELVVKDSGSGIKKENISRIFDPLFTTKALSEGTGLGLTIVHDIVKGIFDGSINVESEAGEGTSFTIHFPPPEKGDTNGKEI